jgi:hypothetical protein
MQTVHNLQLYSAGRQVFRFIELSRKVGNKLGVLAGMDRGRKIGREKDRGKKKKRGHAGTSLCSIYSWLYTVGYSDFHNLIGFTSKMMPNNILKNVFSNVFIFFKSFLANLHSTGFKNTHICTHTTQ